MSPDASMRKIAQLVDEWRGSKLRGGANKMFICTERERLVLCLTLGLDGQQPRTQEEIAHIIGRGKSTVVAIQRQSKAKLLAFLQGE